MSRVDFMLNRRLMSKALISGIGLQPLLRSSVSGAAAQDTDFPMEIESPFGTVTIESVPERVAVIGYTIDLDNVLALGIEPVMAVPVDHPWLDDFDTSTVQWIAWSRDLDFEAILAADPDVIIAVANSNIGVFYDQLVEIAPVVVWGEDLGRQSIVPWAGSLQLTGQVLDRNDEAESVVLETQTLIGEVAKTLVSSEGRSVTVLENAGPDMGVIYHSFTDSAIAEVLGSIGFEASPNASEFGPLNNIVSPEQYALLNDDVLFVIHDTPEFEEWLLDQPLFAELPVVKEGSYISYPIFGDDGEFSPEKYALVEALVAPSALSLQWGIEPFVELIGANLDGDD